MGGIERDQKAWVLGKMRGIKEKQIKTGGKSSVKTHQRGKETWLEKWGKTNIMEENIHVQKRRKKSQDVLTME